MLLLLSFVAAEEADLPYQRRQTDNGDGVGGEGAAERRQSRVTCSAVPHGCNEPWQLPTILCVRGT